jgi:hypothetical protein
MHHPPPALGGSREIEALNGVIGRALAKRPQERYASVVEMAEALDAASVSTGTRPASPTPAATRPGRLGSRSWSKKRNAAGWKSMLLSWTRAVSCCSAAHDLQGVRAPESKWHG